MSEAGVSLCAGALGIDGEAVNVSTPHGPISVTVSGDRSKSALITYHDVGLNHRSCFQGLLLCSGASSLLANNFCIYHIDAPGHEDNSGGVAKTALPLTTDKLADQVASVVEYFGLKELILLGVGAGAYILTKYAIKHQ
ncbi:hypothetical protein CYMTET_22832 [Cymbomonas tetramitiformis]|uniref:Uncharacterized protein n=1 Tax=Cymbomonas tetramitiformis TaxID=36881 RepID=A0AAE0FZ28_9CHLO|nr:hypothetical protein CYMTET_22832 [Cymbomonas tetramitiformis]